MLKWHKNQLKYWQEKIGLSNYSVAWIGFLKGLIFGLLIYHFFIKYKWLIIIINYVIHDNYDI